LQKLNQTHLGLNAGDSRLEARIQAYELAAKMQLSAPEAFDLKGETEPTRQLYGLDDKVTEDFGRRCLTARRLVERGVRFVQVWSGAAGPTNNWDNHASIAKELPPMCAATDKPVAALLKDLKSRGLLEDTLVLWSTEFGRMPFSQGGDGRDHNGGTFVSWMAGAGVKGGVAYGASDEWSWKAAQQATTTYDFHATALHLLGINHEKLTFRHDGADRRLTDVHGEVVREVLA
jgi:arylsulfatase A-like enzyme